VTVPKVEGVIEPGSKNRGGFPRVLSCTEYDYGLGRACLVTRAPDEDRGSRNDPECESRHYCDSQYPTNEIYGLFCFLLCLGSTRHLWKLR
jgi:hypothetical protein